MPYCNNMLSFLTYFSKDKYRIQRFIEILSKLKTLKVQFGFKNLNENGGKGVGGGIFTLESTTSIPLSFLTS